PRFRRRHRMPRAHPPWSRPSSPLGFRLLALRQLVQHIGGLVHPAALAAGLGPHFLDRLPEAERDVGDRKLGPNRKSASLEVKEEFLPGLRTFANAVDQTDELLLALGRMVP